jgi:hypothetical protein
MKLDIANRNKLPFHSLNPLILSSSSYRGDEKTANKPPY